MDSGKIFEDLLEHDCLPWDGCILHWSGWQITGQSGSGVYWRHKDEEDWEPWNKKEERQYLCELFLSLGLLHDELEESLAPMHEDIRTADPLNITKPYRDICNRAHLRMEIFDGGLWFASFNEGSLQIGFRDNMWFVTDDDGDRGITSAEAEQLLASITAQEEQKWQETLALPENSDLPKVSPKRRQNRKS